MSILHYLTQRLMSRCRSCGSSANVLVFDPRGLWAYPLRQTWCPDHCPEHDFDYDRGMRGYYCSICSESAPYDHGRST